MRIGHFEKKACTDWTPGEAKSHYWGFVVVGDKLVPIRLTEKQMQTAHIRAQNNMDDCPKEPGKLEEWVDQLLTGKDIKR